MKNVLTIKNIVKVVTAAAAVGLTLFGFKKVKNKKALECKEE